MMQNFTLSKLRNFWLVSLTATALLLLATPMFTKAQQAIGTDNLLVLVAATNNNNTTVSVVEINKTTANQSPIQTIEIPGTGSNAVRVSGSATTTLYAGNSNDGTLFCFTGHLSDNTGVNANTILPRVVLTINNAGTVTYAATYSGTSGQQTRCATTLDNTNFYIADQGGHYTNNATAPSPTGNYRAIRAFGGTVYVGSQSPTAGLNEVRVMTALTGGEAQAIPGIGNNNTFQDFYFVSSGSNGNTFDVLYILRSTSATAGTIEKYSLVGGTWTSNGTYTTDFGGFSLAAEKSGNGARLYVTSGAGATTANRVIRLTDANGYNAALNITTADNVVLFTAATGTILKGLGFAPRPTVPAGISNLLAERGISIMPNPVDKNQPLHIRFNNSMAARYEVSVYSINGSRVGSQVIQHPGGSGMQRMELPANLTPGIYVVEFVDNKGQRGSTRLVIQ
ncbi:MAG: T9SS type A sorting domain-containing protein [Lacibacter sp.]